MADRDIENARQNHPELVVRDVVALLEATNENLATYGPLRINVDQWAADLRAILKWRGVNKWLRVRRLLIKLKNRWLNRINTETPELARLKAKAVESKHPRDWAAYHHRRGYLKALHECRAQVRVLCHSSRDVDVPPVAGFWGGLDVLPHDIPDLPGKRWLKERDRWRSNGRSTAMAQFLDEVRRCDERWVNQPKEGNQ